MAALLIIVYSKNKILSLKISLYSKYRGFKIGLIMVRILLKVRISGPWVDKPQKRFSH